MRLAHNREHDLPAQAAAIEAFHQWVEALQTFPKPVLAAVEGRAAGGGVSLALACDLVVAAEDARFTMAYSQIGLSPDGGASWQLARRVGQGRALAWLWSGGTHTAQEWASAGLVHRLAPSGTALSAALGWAEQLGKMPPGVLTSIKHLVQSAEGRPLHAHLQAEQAHFLQNLVAPAAGTAIRTFSSAGNHEAVTWGLRPLRPYGSVSRHARTAAPPDATACLPIRRRSCAA